MRSLLLASVALLLAAGCAASRTAMAEPARSAGEMERRGTSAGASTGILREAGIDRIGPTLRRRPLLRLDRPPTVRRHLWDREPTPADRRGEHHVRPHLWDRP